MAVTKDRFELPIAVADSAAELADMVGKAEKTIHNAVAIAEKRGSKRTRYRRVLKEEEVN